MQLIGTFRGTVHGSVRCTQITRNGCPYILVDVRLCNVQPDGLHGLHVHEWGDTSEGCLSAGGHYNPFGVAHGGATGENRHAGDCGNVRACKGQVRQLVWVGPEQLDKWTGRAMVLHAGPDDLGKGSWADSQSTGHSGARLACAVLGLAKPHADRKQ